MKYLVSGSDGPGFATPEEALQLLEDVVLPSLDALNKLQAEKRILAGGLKIGERSFRFRGGSRIKRKAGPDAA